METRKRSHDSDCPSSTIELAQNIKRNDFLHAGTVAHKCLELVGHDAACICLCGYRWVKNFKGKRPE